LAYNVKQFDRFLRVLSPDKHIFEMFDGSKGNARTMEITYTRQ